MRRIAWIVGLISAAIRVAGASEPLEITVQFNNFANVPEREVREAFHEAGWIFRQAGIEVHWVDCPPPTRRPATEPLCADSGEPNLFAFSMLGRTPREASGRAYGFALVSGRANHAAAVYSRIADELKHEPYCRMSDLLAGVMAHELAHLMFRSRQHGDGIMKASWNSRDLRAMTRRKLVFTRRQAQELTRTLAERSSAANHIASR